MVALPMDLDPVFKTLNTHKMNRSITQMIT